MYDISHTPLVPQANNRFNCSGYRQLQYDLAVDLMVREHVVAAVEKGHKSDF